MVGLTRMVVAQPTAELHLLKRSNLLPKNPRTDGSVAAFNKKTLQTQFAICMMCLLKTNKTTSKNAKAPDSATTITKAYSL